MAGQSTILEQFCSLSQDQRHDVLLLLMQKTEITQLRRLYPELKQLLSFDLVSHLPDELSEKVFSYLDAGTLCKGAHCCHRWRNITNSDTLWYRLCQKRGYLKFEHLSQLEWTMQIRPTSPRHTPPPLPHAHNGPSYTHTICKWKLVYMQSHILARNWRLGIYSVAPLLRGHRLPVTSICCGAELLVSGSRDNTARVWSLQSLDCLHVLENHTDAVNCVVIKDSVIVTGCADSLVRVFDSRTGQCLHSLYGHTSSVEHIVLNGNVLASGGSDRSVRMWDVHKGHLMHTLTGHTEEIECLYLSDNVMLSGSWDHTLRVWDVQSGICRHILQGHSEVVYCCDCVGWKVVSGGGDSVLKVWDLESGDVSAILSGHTQEVLCLQCNGDIIASGSADSTIRIWGYSGFCLHVLEGHIGIVRCLHLQGSKLVSGGDQKRIVVWNAETGKEQHTVHRQKALLHQMCVTDTQIITASPDAPGTISVISFW